MLPSSIFMYPVDISLIAVLEARLRAHETSKPPSGIVRHELTRQLTLRALTTTSAQVRAAEYIPDLLPLPATDITSQALRLTKKKSYQLVQVACQPQPRHLSVCLLQPVVPACNNNRTHTSVEQRPERVSRLLQ